MSGSDGAGRRCYLARMAETGQPGNPPQLTPSVAGQYDKAAKAMAQEATNGDVSEDELLESYGTGDRQGKVVGS